MNNPEDAQNVAQETLFFAWRRLGGFRGDSTFSTWLYPIVTRLAMDNSWAHRHDAAPLDQVRDLPAAVPGPAEVTQQAHLHVVLMTAVARLPAPQARVVTLHHLDGFSYAATAELTRDAVPAVRSHLFRARRTLAAAMKQWR